MADEITCHCQHEAIDSFHGASCDIFLVIPARRMLNKPSQYRRGAARLLPKPVPVTRQQGDFAWYDTQFRAPWPARDRLWLQRVVLQAFQHVVRRATKVDFDLAAGAVIKYQHGPVRAGIQRLLGRAHDIDESTAGDQSVMVKCRASDGVLMLHEITRVKT
jgi:hypothetical protein